MKKLTFLILMLVIFSLGSAFSQQNEKSFDEVFNTYNFENSPGFAVLVTKNEEVLYRKAFGFANLELEVKLKPEHIFRIGSITKQFTAAAILKLAEQGKLSLQDDITKYIKDFPTHGHTITIEHLLTHTSGIKSYTSMKNWDAEMRKKNFTPQEMIDFFKNEPTDFAPGEKYLYNNSAYFMLGAIIESVSGKTYQKYIEEDIFKPLEMVNSFYDNSTVIVRNRVSGYQRTRNGFQNADFLSMTQPYAAGSLMSTVDDLFTWYTAIMNDQVISRENRLKAHSSFTLNNGDPTGYGYGWSLGHVHGSPSIEHGGGINGFQSASIYLPQEKVFVAVLSNCIGLSPQLPALKLAAIATGKPFAWEEKPLDRSSLEKFAGVYESGEESRTIVLTNDSLFYVHPSGRQYRLIPFEENKFFANGQLTEYVFATNEKGEVTSFREEGTGYSFPVWKKTDKTADIRKEIHLPAALLEKYAGVYELTPELHITVLREGDKMYARLGDQEKFNILPYDQNRFFSKQFPIEIIFYLNDDKEVTKLIAHQNGIHEAKKIK
ncbi:MAG: serine hydrolase [Mariniphaga sp.]